MDISRKICPCCGYFTVENEDEVIVDICKVCYWQYDLVAHHKPDAMKGANNVTLNQAKNNYKAFGASEQIFMNKVRPPKFDELPENNRSDDIDILL